MLLIVGGASGQRRTARTDRHDLRRGLAPSARPDRQLLHRLLCPLPVCLSTRPQDAGSCGVSRSPRAWPTPSKIKAELARTEAQRQEVMAQANAQATKFIEEARAAAARLQEQETQKAIAAAEQIMAKAREAAAQDHDRMLAELKREVGRLVVQTTAAVTGKILTPEDQRRLAEETARQLTA